MGRRGVARAQVSTQARNEEGQRAMGSSVRPCTELRAVSPSADRLPNPRILQKLAVPIIDTSKCNLLYSKDTESGFQAKAIKDDMLCAGFAEGKKDACKVGAGVGHAGGRALLPRARSRCEPAWLGPGGPSRWGHGPHQSLAFHELGNADSRTPPSMVGQFRGLRWARNLQKPLGRESEQVIWGC